MILIQDFGRGPVEATVLELTYTRFPARTCGRGYSECANCHRAIRPHQTVHCYMAQSSQLHQICMIGTSTPIPGEYRYPRHAVHLCATCAPYIPSPNPPTVGEECPF